MKVTAKIGVAILLSVPLFFSCSKPKGNEKTDFVTLNETIKAGNTYKLNLSGYASPSDAVIVSRQAANYTISEVSKPSGAWVYTFVKAASPKAGTTDHEQVVIKVADNNSRCLVNKEKTNITINFTIE